MPAHAQLLIHIRKCFIKELLFLRARTDDGGSSQFFAVDGVIFHLLLRHDKWDILCIY